MAQPAPGVILTPRAYAEYLRKFGSWNTKGIVNNEDGSITVPPGIVMSGRLQNEDGSMKPWTGEKGTLDMIVDSINKKNAYSGDIFADMMTTDMNMTMGIFTSKTGDYPNKALRYMRIFVKAYTTYIDYMGGEAEIPNLTFMSRKGNVNPAFFKPDTFCFRDDVKMHVYALMFADSVHDLKPVTNLMDMLQIPRKPQPTMMNMFATYLQKVVGVSPTQEVLGSINNITKEMINGAANEDIVLCKNAEFISTLSGDFQSPVVKSNLANIDEIVENMKRVARPDDPLIAGWIFDQSSKGSSHKFMQTLRTQIASDVKLDPENVKVVFETMLKTSERYRINVCLKTLEALGVEQYQDTYQLIMAYKNALERLSAESQKKVTRSATDEIAQLQNQVEQLRQTAEPQIQNIINTRSLMDQYFNTFVLPQTKFDVAKMVPVLSLASFADKGNTQPDHPRGQFKRNLILLCREQSNLMEQIIAKNGQMSQEDYNTLWGSKYFEILMSSFSLDFTTDMYFYIQGMFAIRLFVDDTTYVPTIQFAPYSPGGTCSAKDTSVSRSGLPKNPSFRGVDKSPMLSPKELGFLYKQDPTKWNPAIIIYKFLGDFLILMYCIRNDVFAITGDRLAGAFYVLSTAIVDTLLPRVAFEHDPEHIYITNTLRGEMAPTEMGQMESVKFADIVSEFGDMCSIAQTWAQYVKGLRSQREVDTPAQIMEKKSKKVGRKKAPDYEETEPPVAPPEPIN